MTFRPLLVAGILLGMAGPSSAPAADRHRLGLSAGYWFSMEDRKGSGFDRDGLIYGLSWRTRFPLVAFQADLESQPDRFGRRMLAPQAHALLGRGMYAGAGAGWLVRSGSFAGQPFLAARAGLNVPLPGPLELDLYAAYRFHDRDEWKRGEQRAVADTLVFGAAARLRF